MRPSLRVIRALPACLVVTIAAACTAPTVGPESHLDASGLDARSGADAAAVRAAAIAFVRAYADAPTDGVASLRSSIATASLRRWTFWLGVQNREFPGSTTGRSTIGAVSAPTTPTLNGVPDAAALFRDVQMDARTTFTLTPDHGTSFDVTRTFDGTMRWFRMPDGSWRIVDLVRDGVPMDQAFQVVKGGTVHAGPDLSVTLDAFMAYPYWQFCLIARTGARFTLRPDRVSLVDASGTRVSGARAVTGALRSVDPGRPALGIVSFGLRSSAAGLRLRLEFQGRDGPAEVQIPLEGLITPVPVSSPSASPAG